MKAISFNTAAAKFSMAAALLLLLANTEPAFAQSGPWESTARSVYDLVMSVVRWVAVLGIVGCGIAALAGKLSWEWAIKIIIGLVLIFAAQPLVDYFRQAIGS